MAVQSQANILKAASDYADGSFYLIGKASWNISPDFISIRNPIRLESSFGKNIKIKIRGELVCLFCCTILNHFHLQPDPLPNMSII
jgi:hypothetical protein